MSVGAVKQRAGGNVRQLFRFYFVQAPTVYAAFRDKLVRCDTLQRFEDPCPKFRVVLEGLLQRIFWIKPSTTESGDSTEARVSSFHKCGLSALMGMSQFNSRLVDCKSWCVPHFADGFVFFDPIHFGSTIFCCSRFRNAIEPYVWNDFPPEHRRAISAIEARNNAMMKLHVTWNLLKSFPS